jgi:hypothetical protein
VFVLPPLEPAATGAAAAARTAGRGVAAYLPPRLGEVRSLVPVPRGQASPGRSATPSGQAAWRAPDPTHRPDGVR